MPTLHTLCTLFFILELKQYVHVNNRNLLSKTRAVCKGVWGSTPSQMLQIFFCTVKICFKIFVGWSMARSF